MAKDAELVNFSEEYELNNILKKHGKSQSEANRKIGKKILSQDEFGEFVKKNLAKLA